jgi:hypothetical protein
MLSVSSDIIESINKEWAIELRPSLSEDDLIDAFAIHVNDMIVHHFSQLITALYRIDVSEQKIRQTLIENPKADAGRIIAHLVVERQKQKIKTREQFSPRENHNDEEEKW